MKESQGPNSRLKGGRNAGTSRSGIIRQLHQEEGVTILLVEQNARMALHLADRAYVLETGRIVLQGKSADLLKDEYVKRAYLGG